LGPFDATFHIPAFIEGKRLTINGSHFVDKTPISETIFATDKIFGYETSNVKKLLFQQSKSQINFEEIQNLFLSDIEMLNDKENNIVIAGLIPSICPQYDFSLELIRGLAWDERLNQSIPQRINNMKASQNKYYIETTSEDNKLNDILNISNWEISEERVLLGRSVWKRQNGYKLKSLETELLTNLVGNLQQQPELPSTIQIEKNK